jgi:hypothetical protein
MARSVPTYSRPPANSAWKAWCRSAETDHIGPALAGLGQGEEPQAPRYGKSEGSFRMTNKDAFDLWWQWATKPHESMLSIDGDIHYPIIELSQEDRRDREKVDEAVRRCQERQKRST